MIYHIVAGEELKKIMTRVLDNPIPFNEDMSVGSYHSKPFTEGFLKERSEAHHVSVSTYKEKLQLFLKTIDVVDNNDEIHLYFGEDKTCVANRNFLIQYFTNKVRKITLHIVNEYTGEELKLLDINKD